VERGVYFDAWFPGQHCYHPGLPPRRLRMVEHLVDYHATVLVWAALGGGSIALPYLEQEAFGEIDPRFRFYGFLNDAEFIAECRKKGIKVFGIVFEVQGWEFPVELNETEDRILALNETRGAGNATGSGSGSSRGIATPISGRRSSTTFPAGWSIAMASRSATCSRKPARATSTACPATRTGWSARTGSTSATRWIATIRSGASI
jgi:hypothetical protein